MLLVDTGPLVAYINRKDPDHEACAALFTSRTDNLLITPYVLTEACYLVGKYVSADAEINLIEAVAVGDLVQVDVSAADMERIAELARQYRSFPLGIADASVIAIAERLDLEEVATLDHRHFRAVRPKHCDALTVLP